MLVAGTHSGGLPARAQINRGIRMNLRLKVDTYKNGLALGPAPSVEKLNCRIARHLNLQPFNICR